MRNIYNGRILFTVGRYPGYQINAPTGTNHGCALWPSGQCVQQYQQANTVLVAKSILAFFIVDTHQECNSPAIGSLQAISPKEN